MQRISLQPCRRRVMIPCLILTSVFMAPAWAQSSQNGNLNSNVNGTVNLQHYLRAVENNSLDLQAQQELVSSAKAGISIAGVRPDPQFTAGIDSKELYGPNKPNTTTTTAGIAITVETANKRQARINAAESNVRLTEATVSAFKRQLMADAATSFIEACRSSASLTRKETSLNALRDIVRMNETRLKAGDIGKLELVQSKVEADRFAAEVNIARADTQNALAVLSNFLGKNYDDAFSGQKINCDIFHAGKPNGQADPFDDINKLIQQALEKREDIQLARSSAENARDNIGLARANRWIDPVINLGIKNTPKVNAIQNASGMVTNSPAERSNMLGLTITVPIPFSRTQSGELMQAQSALTQASLQLRSVLLKAEIDVRNTYLQYQAARQNLSNYKEYVLDDSERLLQGVRTSYRKGSASMLELLNAQRNADEIFLAYLQAEANAANAKIKLQQSIAYSSP